jgi:gliding motility-associated-like protein
MRSNLFLLVLLTLSFSGKLYSQQIVNHHAEFNSGVQNMWGPSFSPITLDQTITLFDVPWDVNWNTGSSGIFSIAGFDFGGALSGSFSGVVGSEIRIEGFTTGTVEVDYPVDIELNMPTDSTYDQGDNVTIETSYTVENTWDFQSLYPSAGEFFWDFYFRMAAQASAQLCFFGCTTFPIIPAFDTGVQTINLITISGNGASTAGTTGIWYLGPGDPFGPDQPPAPAGGLWPYAKPPGDGSGTVGIDWIPWQVHIGAFPADLPDVGFGLSGSITIPYVETAPVLTGTDISACGDSTYFNLNLEIFQLLGNILANVPGPVGVFGNIIANLSGSQSLGIAEVNWNFFSASFDANITNNQCFDFTPTIYGQFLFPVAVDYQVTDPLGTVLSSGQSSIINLEIGNDLTYKFPCYFEEMNIVPTYSIDGVFRNHTYDVVSFDFLMSAFEFGFTVPAVTVIPGFTIPSVCFPVPYPCPTWSNPFRWCTTTVCTPTIVVPPIGFGGWSLGIGPLWETSIPIGSFSYDWFDDTWSLEGFSDTTFAPFTMIANKLNINTTFTDVNCFGDADGTIGVTIDAVSDALPYNYTWTNGTNVPAGTDSESLVNLAAGPYQVSVIDGNGCQLFSGATISEPQLLELSYQKVDKSCNVGPNNGLIDVDVIGGTAPYSYNWSSGQTTQDISGLGVGSYSLTVTDFRNCTANVTVDIVEPTLLGQVGVVTEVNCRGGNDGAIGVTTFGGTLPYVYSWNSGQNTEDVSGLTANTYTLTITDNNGCVNAANYLVAEPLTSVAVSTTAVDVLCNGGTNGSIDATVGGGTPGYTFMWSNLVNGVLPFTTEDINNVPAGNYTITVTDTRGCQAQASQVIAQPVAALAANPTITNVLCFGDLTGSINPGITGGTAPYNYNWTNGATTAVLSGVMAGSYGLNLTDNNGCTANWTWTISEPNAALGIVLSGTDVLCHGDATGTVSSVVTGGTTPYSYLWNNGASTPNLSAVSAGNYDLTVTDDHGCVEVASFVVNQPLAPLALSSTAIDVDCHGNNSGSVDLTVSGGTAPYSHMWSNGGSIVLSTITEDLNNQFADVYTVLVTDANGCQETTSQIVNQPTAPLAISGIINDANCFGLNDGAIDITVTGGTTAYSYLWSNGAVSQDITAVVSGTYTVDVTDNNGCTLSANYFVGQPVAPLTVVTFPFDVLCNGDLTGRVFSEVTGGTAPYTYNWSNGATSEDIISVSAGTYTLTVTDAQGCIAFTGATVNEPPVLAFTAAVTDASCYNYSDGEIVLTITGGVQPYYFNWGDQNEILLNNPSETLSNLPAEDYFVRVRDANNCMVEQIVTVGQPTPFVATHVVTDVTCFEGNDGEIDVTISGGTLPYGTNWSNGQTTEDAVNLIEGYYTYTVNDGMGCILVDSAYVAQPSEIQIYYEVLPVSCVDQTDASIVVTTFGGTPPYAYAWSEGTTEQNLVSVGPGTYQLIITDSYSCIETFDFEIFINDVECLIIPNSFTPNGDAYNDTWVVGNMELYPNAMVKIFNKWGNELYTSNGIYVPWDGTHNGSPLPSDVYYYIIELNNDDNNKYTGNVTIVR